MAGRRKEAGASLRTQQGFSQFATGLVGVSLSEQWEALVAKVGGKVFALLGNDGALVFKVSETSFVGLTTVEGVGQAAYFAKGQWVNVAPDAPLSDADLMTYIREAHRLIASKLTRKLRAELGLDGQP